MSSPCPPESPPPESPPPEVRSLVFVGPGKSFLSRSSSWPRLAAGELLVRVRGCTLCGSDLHTLHGRRGCPHPVVLGHEILGELVEWPAGETPTDSAGTPLRAGDRLTWSLCAACGQCYFCRRDLPQKCEHLLKYGHADADRYPLSGGMSEYCRLERGTCCWRVPEELPDSVACPANCATATVECLFRTLDDLSGGTVVVLGGGMLGLTAAARAHVSGAAAIVLVEPRAERARRAPEFGATHVVAGEGAELRDLVRELTAGRGADAVCELSGAAAALASACEVVRIGGQVVLAGSVFPSPPWSLAPEMLVRRMLRIAGIHNYHPRDLAAALAFLDRWHTRFPFSQLVAKPVYEWDQLDQALRAADQPGSVRVAVAPAPARFTLS